MSARVLARIFLLSLTLFSGYFSFAQNTSSWAAASKKHKGTITVYWFESRPFVYQDVQGNMMGIEYEIMMGFKKYLREKKGIDLTMNWVKASSFSGLYSRIKEGKGDGTFGASAFSITEKRKQDVAFSASYMSDISVLITNKNVPVATSLDEFVSMMPKLTAITIKETTYEQDLLKLQKQAADPFSISYISSSENILRTIEKMENTFGFIDLPVYMLLFSEDPSLSVKRQNLLTIKRDGYAFTFPKSSDWVGPFNEFFETPNFRSELERIIGKYIDRDLYHFVEGLAVQSNDQVISLLNKEKEIQYEDLLLKNKIILDSTRTRNLLIGVTVIVLIFMFSIYALYRKRNEQKRKIELQQKDIEVQRDQLAQRNRHLLALDDEKNNLIKILAHDLRTPINHVQGLAHVFLLSNQDLPDDQKQVITQITDAAVRLNRMITHVLDIDALENDRVTVFMDDVNLTELVQKVTDSFEKQAAKKEIRIVTLLQPDIRIKGDSLFLIQVFENLLSNAIKFSHHGKSIEVSAQRIAGRAQVKIKDSGPGLTAEDHKHLFRKFHRLSAKPTAGEPSVGLGLSIVKRYVELMGGTVSCESHHGEGATFTVEFP